MVEQKDPNDVSLEVVREYLKGLAIINDIDSDIRGYVGQRLDSAKLVILNAVAMYLNESGYNYIAIQISKDKVIPIGSEDEEGDILTIEALQEIAGIEKESGYSSDG